ncbi:proline-rich protein 35 isoform X2 [Motacilla alba alba]|uniref:proline-rich protein 35 isoform X2 n=1 Tax=Motacilla alba alba TaxID=1094192 RepID=UPI0018D59F68|nr:proline-rich protein 35 isoform X2 [Motacilla alba alba]
MLRSGSGHHLPPASAGFGDAGSQTGGTALAPLPQPPRRLPALSGDPAGTGAELSHLQAASTMSKDDGACKLTSVYKHKERKPKKPHYIPRPWGKPYNYKCFQCPFTCMEKSHLYNHMKYSLCKNSLSLLIESDWPYKKGNLLHPELRLLHTESSRLRGRRDEQDTCDPAATPGGSVRAKQVPSRDGHEEKPMTGVEILPAEGAGEEGGQFQEEEEDVSGLLREMDAGEKKERNEEPGCQGDPAEPEVNTLVFGFKNKRDNKPCKEVEPDFIITDVFSLKNHVMKNREMASPDLDAKPKHCKLPKKCLASGGILMEQWKLVANGQRRNTPEVSPPCTDSNIIPCYPPPAYSDYHEPQSLNLSLLGINYPLNPSLFSYLSPTMANSTTTHPHLAQLPFLASTAQLMHPHASHFQPLQSPERSAFLPRFYYPLLFEHTFSSTESKMSSSKPDPQQLVGSVMPTPPQNKPSSEPNKPGLLKVPVLKTSFPWSKGVREEPGSELSHSAVVGQEEEEKWLSQEKESNPALGLSNLRKKSATDIYQTMVGMKDGAFTHSSVRKTELPVVTCLETSSPPRNPLKRKFPADGLDLIGPERMMPGKLSYQSSGPRANPGHIPKALDHWHSDVLTGQPEEPESGNDTEFLPSVGAALDHGLYKQSQPQESSAITGPEATTVLIGDLSKTLEEYQEVEKKLSDLAKEDTPGQKELRDQLVKIRRELYHIHQALEKATKPHEGPLDLSVKRSSEGLEKVQQAKKEPCNMSLGSEKLHGKDQGPLSKCPATGEAGDGDGLPNCLLESENKTIDLLIKMSRSESLRAASSEAPLGAVIKAEVLPLTVPLELRHVMEPYYSRTTKCEADSSVLLCSDGRSSSTQGPQLPASAEDGPLGCRAMQRSLSCSLPSDTDAVCVHSPLHADP